MTTVVRVTTVAQSVTRHGRCLRGSKMAATWALVEVSLSNNNKTHQNRFLDRGGAKLEVGLWGYPAIGIVEVPGSICPFFPVYLKP